VLKWLGTIPAVGVCTLCNLEFKVPVTAVKRKSISSFNLISISARKSRRLAFLTGSLCFLRRL